MDDQNKNLILATALSFLVILVWFVMFPPPPPPDYSTTEGTEASVGTTDGLTPPAATTPSGAPAAPIATPAETRDAALSSTERVSIQTPRLVGSISLTGGRIDDLKLTDYLTELGEDGEIVTLLSPAGGPGAYYALHGWVGQEGLAPDAVPGPSTEWTAPDGATLTPETPVTLTWDNGQGLVFSKTIAVDEDYLFTITQGVENTTGQAISLFPYGVLARHGEPEQINFFVLHEGLISFADGTLTEDHYDDLRDYDPVPAEGGTAERTQVAENGWIGFTDHYWMATLIGGPDQPLTTVAKHTTSRDIYQTDIRLPAITVEAGTTGTSQTRFFAGAKEAEVIAKYQNELSIERFVDSIDWGWFAFFTKPIFWALHYLNLWIGNMGWAIIGLTLIIKALLLPLAYKSYVSLAKMKELQPEMEKIKERAGEDRQKLQQEMMALYKEKKVNPASGCLPILVQIPIFFSLYKVIFVTIELRHAPFFGWIQDLSAPDPSSILNLFGVLPWGVPDPTSLFAIFSIGVYPILMGITMWMQQKLNPAPTDKTQAMIFAWMPWVFMFMLGTFASGLVIYWTANNIITFLQQYFIMRSQGVKPDVFGNIMSSFKRDKTSD